MMVKFKHGHRILTLVTPNMANSSMRMLRLHGSIAATSQNFR